MVDKGRSFSFCLVIFMLFFLVSFHLFLMLLRTVGLQCCESQLVAKMEEGLENNGQVRSIEDRRKVEAAAR